MNFNKSFIIYNILLALVLLSTEIRNLSFRIPNELYIFIAIFFLNDFKDSQLLYFHAS